MRNISKLAVMLLVAAMAQSCFIFRESSTTTPSTVQTIPYRIGGGDYSASSVRNLNIKWLDGLVDVIYYDGTTVKFYESSDHALTNETTMYHYFDGSTLYIIYGKDGALNRYASEKKLTVLLPTGTTYRNFQLTACETSVFVDIDANYVNMSTVEGDVRFGTMINPVTLKIKTESGPIDCILPYNASFKLVTATESGKFTSDFNLKRYSSYYLYGSGYSSITLDSGSGNVALIRAESL